MTKKETLQPTEKPNHLISWEKNEQQRTPLLGVRRRNF